MANNTSHPTLYTGVTNNLKRRVQEHKQEIADGFTKKYHLHNLVYYEVIEGQIQAIVKEKQIKDMEREEKLEMIKNVNPLFRDIYYDFLKDKTWY